MKKMSKLLKLNLKPNFSFIVTRTLKHGLSLEKDICSNKAIKPILDVSCKSAVITGGAEGIGLSIAHQILAKNAQRVALIGINNCAGKETVNNLNCAYGKNKAIFFNCDVQCTKEVTKCYERIMKEFGKLDFVVNSAGVFDNQQWECEIQTNLVGTISSSLAAYKIMSKENGGSGGTILNVTGMHGFKPLHAAPTVTAPFGGVIAFSRSLGHKVNVQKSGVRVVTLCTGLTNTKFLEGAEKRALNERFKVQIETLFCKMQRQNADVCGKSGMHVLEHGRDGSVWVVEGSKLYLLKFPNWKKLAELKSQLI